MVNKVDQVLGGIWGLLVGDAVGVPYEFYSAEDIKALEFIDIIPPSSFRRSHSSVPIGTWSDDGAQALCLLDSLLSCGKFDINDFANRMLSWYEEGLWAVDSEVFDVGIQTAEALVAYSNGTKPDKSGLIRPDGKGNGALMRVLPLAIWHKGKDEELIEDAHKQSLVTHGHPCNQVCCALYCLWARGIINGMEIEEAYGSAIKTLRNIYTEDSGYMRELEWSIRPDDPIPGTGSGYVVDSLRSVRMVLKNNTYESVIKSAIALGEDTDTTAAIAGGLAGLKYGFNNIPEKWIEKMRGRELVEPLLNRLVKL